MHAAAEHLSSVTLELGGKSPVVLHEDCDPVEAAHRIAWGKWINAGQTCIAPDYVLVPRKLKAPFIRALHEQVQRFYGATAVEQKQSPDFARVIHSRHFERIQSAVEKSVTAGAVVEFGRDYDATQKYISPTVLSSVAATHPIMQEEIFGPVLPVMEYERERDALDLIRSQDKPLALYLFSNDSHWVERMLHSTTSGGVTANHVTLHVANPYLPFGGVGASGLGSYHGEYGFKAFSHERAVFYSGRGFSPLKWFLPPYSGTTRRLIGWVKKTL
jgi:aldehyde dehydrogenase (NAD+)